MKPLTYGLVLLYGSLIPLHLVQLGEPTRRIMVGAELLLAAFFLIQWLAIRRREVSPPLLRVVTLGFIALPYLSALLLFALDPDPFHTGYVVVLVIACGGLLLSRSWAVASIALLAASWLGLMSLALPGSAVRVAAVLVVAVTVAFAMYLSRRRRERATREALDRAAEEIAQREAAERTLRESEHRLELAIRASRGGWWEILLDPRRPLEIPDRAQLSPALKRLIGFAPDEFPESLQAWRARILDEDRERVERSASEHLAGNRPDHRARYRIRHKSGEIRWMEALGRVEGDEAGRPLRFTGVDWDITDRIEQERSLRVLSQAVEQSPSIVLITDPEWNIEYVNPKFCRVTGYDPQEVYGRNPSLLKSGEVSPEVYSELRATVTAGGEWHGELLNRAKSGDLYWVLASISAVTDDTGSVLHYVGVQEDITARKQAEEQLVRSQRLEAVGQLVSGVAHDFNNLLTTIIGFSQLTADALPEDSQGCRDDLEKVMAAGEAAADLTRHLLAIGRQQILRPRVLDLGTEIRKTEELLRRTLGEDIEVEVQLDPDAGNVRVDASQLQQILLNLALNARDAMPQGGVLTFETANVEIDETYIKSHMGARAGSFVMLAVSDTGCGMGPSVLKRIFEPFFTTKKRGQGTGLGLATTYGIVKQSGGYIWAYSEPGKGTTFKVYFPRHEEAAEAAPRPVPAERAGGSETVLLVEDADHVRGLLAQALTGDGYTVLEASDSTEALQVAEEHPGPIDLLITDLVLPTDNGLTLAAELRRRRKSLKTLLITGYAESVLRRKHALQPDLPLLTKPFTMSDLARSVRQTLDGDAEDAGAGAGGVG